MPKPAPAHHAHFVPKVEDFGLLSRLRVHFVQVSGPSVNPVAQPPSHPTHFYPQVKCLKETHSH